MKTCWAAPLGGCSDKLSVEHTVTKALFNTDEIFVQGFSWCLDEPKRIGLANAAKKQLCVAHNSQLSETDDAAVCIARAFDRVSRRPNCLAESGTIARLPDTEVDGRAFERWALKTLINIGTESGFAIGKNSNQPNVPSPLLAKLAFGVHRFPYRTGVYFVGDPHGQFGFANRFTFMPFMSPTNYILGTMFLFCGFRFCLLLEDPEMTVEKLRVLRNSTLVDNPPVGYHPDELQLEVEDRRLTLKFNW